MKKSMIILSSIVGILVLGIILLSLNKGSGSITKVNGDKAREILESDTNAILIDVRTQEEYDTSHISGSILIPYDIIGDVIENTIPDKNTKIILYCRSGNRSSQAAKTLEKLGYQNIYDLGAKDNW